VDTILIIDDDDQLRLSFKKLLAAESYQVIEAASGETGCDLIAKGPIPDLVILDIRLPGMNGLETFKKIHRIDRKLPIIIMTAYGTTETAIEATKMGAFDYILKPFEIPDMLAAIKQALGTGRFRRSLVDVDIMPQGILGGSDHRTQQTHAGCIQGHRKGVRIRRHDPGARRIRYRQGIGGACDLSAQPQGG
jgi:DNA-binding NtrC family response regulator